MALPIYIGAAAYERSYGIQFIHENDATANITGNNIRVLPHYERWSMRGDLRGKSVAVVGNGKVIGCGPAIDSHDVVIRISTMRQWTRSAADDGTRLSIWAGQPVFVVQNSNGAPLASPLFKDAVDSGVELWGQSPFHVPLHAFRWMTAAGAWPRFQVTPPPAVIFEQMCRVLDADELNLLFAPNTTRRFLVGFPLYDLLLTGTRLLLLLEHACVGKLSIFGFDLFNAEPQNLWFGHSPEIDHRVMLAIKMRMQQAGANFYWHEETALERAMPAPNPGPSN